MIRFIKKLLLRRDTVRTLTTKDLRVVNGAGGNTNCGFVSEQSGCPRHAVDPTESP